LTNRERLVAGIVTAAFLAITALASVPNVAISQNSKIMTEGVKRALPQGWGFFTKSGRDPSISPYSVRNGKAQNISMAPVGQPKYALGFSRTGRAQGIEVGILLQNLVGAWTSCLDLTSVDECVDTAAKKSPSRTVENPTPDPTVCGDTLLLESEPTLLLYREVINQERRALRAARITVKCTQK